MAPEHGPAASDGHLVGVCYLTASVDRGTDICELRVRIALTTDVTSQESTSRYSVGPDTVTDIVREWMSLMCAEV